jgi:hypothetical protein
MTREQIEAKLHEELAIAYLRSGADPDSVERRSELELAQRRYTGQFIDGVIPSSLKKHKVMAQTA